MDGIGNKHSRANQHIDPDCNIHGYGYRDAIAHGISDTDDNPHAEPDEDANANLYVHSNENAVTDLYRLCHTDGDGHADGVAYLNCNAHLYRD